MKRIFTLLATVFLISCAGSGGQFSGWQTEDFGSTRITEGTSRTFVLANDSDSSEQHIRAIAFDRGSNAAGHFRIVSLRVGDQTVGPTDIVIPPMGELKVTVGYSPLNLEPSQADYGGWETGRPERWIPKNPDEVGRERAPPVLHRAIIEAVYDYPKDGIYYVQVVGEAKRGPRGEEEAGGAFATCTPGGGTACYTGDFALDIPELAPGGPKPLEMTGPIKMSLGGGVVTMRMDDFPFVLYVLRSEDIPQLPSGVTATLVISGTQGEEATGTFDGSRLSISNVTFRIRVALGELTVEQVRQGMSALVDFKNMIGN